MYVFKYPKTVEDNKLLPAYKPLLFIFTYEFSFIWNTCEAPIETLYINCNLF